MNEPILIERSAFTDERGFFLESFNQKEFDEAVGHHTSFVQDNHSRSSHGVLRGLHYQLPPAEQGKLVRVASGTIFDVAVDIRRSSPHFGEWVAYELSAANHLQLWVPPGFAHGFLVLSDSADVIYKTTSYYAPAAERAVRWDDPDLAIAWPGLDVDPIISPKDSSAPSLREADTFE